MIDGDQVGEKHIEKIKKQPVFSKQKLYIFTKNCTSFIKYSSDVYRVPFENKDVTDTFLIMTLSKMLVTEKIKHVAIMSSDHVFLNAFLYIKMNYPNIVRVYIPVGSLLLTSKLVHHVHYIK